MKSRARHFSGRVRSDTLGFVGKERGQTEDMELWFSAERYSARRHKTSTMEPLCGSAVHQPNQNFPSLSFREYMNLLDLDLRSRCPKTEHKQRKGRLAYTAAHISKCARHERKRFTTGSGTASPLQSFYHSRRLRPFLDTGEDQRSRMCDAAVGQIGLRTCVSTQNLDQLVARSR